MILCKKRIYYIAITLMLVVLSVLFLNSRVSAEPESEEVISIPIIEEEQEQEEDQENMRIKMVVIGDSYAMGYTPDDSIDPETEAWTSQVIAQNGTQDSIIVTKIGAGFVKSNEGDSFATLLEKAWEMSDDPDSVETIVVCGGYNDMFYNSSTIYYAAQFFANTAKRLFPNAEISIGMISWHENNTEVQEQLLSNVLPAYRQCAELNGMHYIAGCEYLYQNSYGLFALDHFHPNAQGQKLLAEYITRYLQGQEYYSGLKCVDGTWYYYENGEVSEDFTGLKRNEYGWWYIQNGIVDFSYNGFAVNEEGWWYVEDGHITFHKTDILNGFANTDPKEEEEEAWWFVQGSKVTDTKTVAKNAYGWWYVNAGKVDFTYTGVQKNEYGWWYINEGKVDFQYNGFASNEYGWWYAENGKVTFEKDDIIQGFANIDTGLEGEEAWWFITGSRVTRAETVAKNAYGWWYVNAGKVDFTYTGVQKNENGWWYVNEGKVDFQYNGFASNTYGWWYIQNSKVEFIDEDIIYGNANTDPDLDGENGWWLIRDGKVVDETTVAKNAYGWWYVRNGKVDFLYSGFEFIDNCIWHIKEGKAELIVRY